MKESGHWYKRDGTACHTVANKTKGGMRAVNIRDARSLGLLPSVTTILSVMAKPQLDDWKMKQVALAAISSDRRDGEPEEAFVARIIEDAFKQVEDAADLGTKIHKALEDFFLGHDLDEDMLPYLRPVEQFVKDEGIRFDSHELRLVNERHGYAGTTDAAFACPRGRGIMDFKTRKSKPEYPMTPYDGQAMQVAAYHVAHYGEIQDDAVGCNVFISTTEVGRVEATWYAADQLRAEWDAFTHLCAVWRHMKQHDPRDSKDLIPA